MKTPSRRRAAALLLAGTIGFLHGDAPRSMLQAQDEAPIAPSVLSSGWRQFYNGHYETAVATARTLRETDAEYVEAFELRTSALLFQIKRLLGEAPDKRDALAQCASCAALMQAFLADTAAGQAAARARLKANPSDEPAMFLLGRLDLNYVWLQVGTIGRRTGWSEYWEARRSLDDVLKRNPGHVRARVARAWIDYIVDTKVPRGTKWILGGGSRKKALAAVRQAANMDGDVWVRAEADFGLWDMLVRERDIPAAVVAAQTLVRDFPENAELTKFLLEHGDKETALVLLHGPAVVK